MRFRGKSVNSLPAVSLLRISIGVIYLWFGALKFFAGYSPAEALAIKTISKLTFGVFNSSTELLFLAVWETIIGITLILGKAVKPILVLMFIHMVCTFSPLFLFPEDSFRHLPYGLSLTGQYIVKNLVIICAGLVIWQAEREKANQSIVRGSLKAINGKQIVEERNVVSETQ